MKKFVAGVAVGALIFGAVPVFADSIKSLVGAKVTGVYTVEQGGKKIADGAVINGSAYVPVRAIADATGTKITVEGKNIILGQTEVELKEDEVRAKLEESKEYLAKLEVAMPIYEQNVADAQKRVSAGENLAQYALDTAQRDEREARARIIELKQEIAQLEEDLRNLK